MGRSASAALPGFGTRSLEPSRWGQKIGSADKYSEWKLFIGQVPLEVSIADVASLTDV